MSACKVLHQRPVLPTASSVTEVGLQKYLQALRRPRMDNPRSDVLIGVDGGSSKTHCVVLCCSSLTCIASVRGGGCNGNSEGKLEADEVLTDCIEAALVQADLRPDQVKGVACGLSGIDTRNDAKIKKQVLRNFMQQLNVPDHVPCWVFNDAIAALSAATRGPPYGVSVIAGTGSICVGIAGNSFHRASGWGGTVGDGGSGFDIGRKALAAVAAAVDERQRPTALSSALARACNVTTMSDLLSWVYQDTSWAGIASLAPSVVSCASAGDSVATEILEQAASELVQGVVAVAGKLHPSVAAGRVPIVLSGGLLNPQPQSVYGDMIVQQLNETLPGHKILRPVVDSATGAALLGAHYLRSETSDHEGAYCQGLIDELPGNVLVEPTVLNSDTLAGARKHQ